MNDLEEKIEKLNIRLANIKEEEKERHEKHLFIILLIVLTSLLFSGIATYKTYKRFSTPDTIIIDDATFNGQKVAYRLKGDLPPDMKENVTKEELKKFFEAFFDKSTREPRSREIMLSMASPEVLKIYRDMYKEFIKETKSTYDKYWNTSKVLDVNLVDDHTADIRWQVVLYLKKPLKEGDAIIDKRVFITRLKFKFADLKRTSSQRQFNPLDLQVTDLKEIN